MTILSLILVTILIRNLFFCHILIFKLVLASIFPSLILRKIMFKSYNIINFFKENRANYSVAKKLHI